MSIAEKFEIIADEVYEKGVDVGYKQGVLDGNSKDYNDGKQAQYDEFWDAYQDNGNRTSYSYAFPQRGWNDSTFKPKFDIKPIDLEYGFIRCQCTKKMQDIETECNIKFDFSNCTKFAYAFFYSEFKELPDIDLSKAETNLSRTFMGCKAEKIGTVTVNKDQNFTMVFHACEPLKQITFAGTIGKNGLNLAYSTLDHDSVMSVVNALEDKTGDTSGTTWLVTLGNKNIAQLSDAEKAMATEKGWTLA